MTLAAAITAVLTESRGPMRAGEVVDALATHASYRGPRNPASVVTILSILAQDPSSPVARVARGQYAVATTLHAPAGPSPERTIDHPAATVTVAPPAEALPANGDDRARVLEKAGDPHTDRAAPPSSAHASVPPAAPLRPSSRRRASRAATAVPADETEVLDFLATLDSAPVLAPPGAGPYGGTGWRDDLTRRMRVLLHAEPLLALRAADGMQAVDRRHYDSLALALRVFDLVGASMGLDTGVDRASIETALRPLLLAMDRLEGVEPDGDRHLAVVDRVLHALLNNEDRREAFRAVYTDIRPDGAAERVQLPFRLLEEYQQPDGNNALRLTSEAINLYLGACDRDIEDEQVAAEALIREQLERGSFAKAVHSANQAQLQSRRYALAINTKLRLTRRDINLVNWRDEVTPIIESAHDHVERRLRAERAILEVANEQAERLVPGTEAAEQVATVARLIAQCCTRHAQLSLTLVAARRSFLDEQGRQGFAAVLAGRRPDFVRDVLEPTLLQPMARAVTVTDAALGAIAAPAPVPLVDLNAVIAWCLRPRRELAVGVVSAVSPELEERPEPLAHFPPEVQREAMAILRRLPARTRLSTLLADGMQHGWSAPLTECILLLSVLEHGRDPTHLPLVEVIPTDVRFDVAGITGDDLILVPVPVRTTSLFSGETA